METKICKKCGEEKALAIDFRGKTKKNGKTYYSHTCKKCVTDNEKDRKSEWYFSNKNRLVVKYHENYLENKEERIKQSRQYYQDNKEECAVRNAKYIKLHPEVKKKCSNNYHATHKEDEKQYREKNKKQLNKKNAIRVRNRRKTDTNFKLRTNVSRSINLALKGKKNKKSILKYLSYTMQQLKDHLEQQFKSWMIWDNWRKYDPKTWNDNDPSTWAWNIDHIIPQSDLPYTSMTDDNFKKCWALENLRPYSAKQNCLDGVLKVRHRRAKS